MTDAVNESSLPRAATPYLQFDEQGEPFLRGARCKHCDEVFLGDREHCANCCAQSCMSRVSLSTSGRLYNYTVVHRSYPGVEVPFISAIVDLDDGCSVKGNLLEIEPSSEVLAFDMPVKVVFRGAELAKPEGEGFLSHFFVPA